jgi:TetR/AcrR family transcriptional regulator, lmrAB and yxaGH operons repressor
MAKADVRGAMIAGATRLLAEKGLEGTSFADVLQLTGAPRGSTYHHFPGGKQELVAAAVDLAGGRAAAALEQLRGQSPTEVVSTFLDLWRRLLAATDLRAGCAVLAVTVAADDDDLLRRAGEVFRTWRRLLAELLVAGGLPADRAGRTAALVISAAEGAVVLARAERDWEPFDLVAEQLLLEVGRL